MCVIHVVVYKVKSGMISRLSVCESQYVGVEVRPNKTWTGLYLSLFLTSFPPAGLKGSLQNTPTGPPKPKRVKISRCGSACVVWQLLFVKKYFIQILLRNSNMWNVQWSGVWL